MSHRYTQRAITVLTLTALTGLALAAQPSAHADTVAQATDGTLPNFSQGEYGQAFTVATSGPENTITFSFMTFGNPSTPYATGNGFLLSSEYLGTPSALSTTTPGFLGEATASGGQYAFAPSLTLQAGTQYFFYENGTIPQFALEGGSAYSGGLSYTAFDTDSSFFVLNNSSNFLVTGHAAPAGTPTPEPGGLLPIAFGLLGLGGLAFKAKKRLVTAA